MSPRLTFAVPLMAPPEMSGGAAPAVEVSDARKATLRKLAAELIDLRTALLRVQKGQVDLESQAAYIKKTMADLGQLMAALGDDDTQYADVIRHLSNAWEQMNTCPVLTSPEKALTAQQQLHRLEMIDEHIRTALFNIGLITIPGRVSQWLAQARPGYYIPFHLVFADELPSEEDRIKMVNALFWAPETVKNGYVDPDSAVIYRRSSARGWKALAQAIGMMAGILAVSTAVVYGLCRIPDGGWPIKVADAPKMLVGWGALLCGILVHIAVGMAKRRNSKNSLPPVVVLGDLPTILLTKAGQVVLKVVLALIALFGLAYGGGIGNVTLVTTFLVGYSLDSFIEIFGASLDNQAAAQTGMLKKQLGVGSAP